MPATRKLLRHGAEALAFIALILALYAWQTRNLLPTKAQLAPPLSVVALDGAPFDINATAGSATLVYFFAPWCNICAVSSGNINWLRKLRAENELRILLVALDWRTRDEVQDYVDRHEIAVPVLLGHAQVASEWNIFAFPTYYMLDSELRIVHRDLGYTTLAGLWWRSVLVD